MISVCHYAKTNLRPHNLTFIIYNFQSKILRGDAHNKHILIILVIDSWNSDSFKNDFLNFNEMRTENRTENPIVPLIKKVEFQHDGYEVSELHTIG